jgi:hypothetical protein
MCTVTFVPVKDRYFITSNRDEKVFRKQAIPPSLYYIDNIKLIFPKDADANGTWIALHENGNAAVLLNGGFVYHQSKPPYAKSRGLVFLEIFKANTPAKQFLQIDLFKIEPFTIILFDNEALYECRWDGKKKSCIQLNTYQPHIWSSVTLYDQFTIKKREQWFSNFINNIPKPTQQDILNFHRFAGDGNKRNDLFMCRDDIYSTVSITSILLTNDRGSMKYFDIKNNQSSEMKIEFLSEYELS